VPLPLPQPQPTLISNHYGISNVPAVQHRSVPHHFLANTKGNICSISLCMHNTTEQHTGSLTAACWLFCSLQNTVGTVPHMILRRFRLSHCLPTSPDTPTLCTTQSHDNMHVGSHDIEHSKSTQQVTDGTNNTGTAQSHRKLEPANTKLSTKLHPASCREGGATASSKSLQSTCHLHCDTVFLSNHDDSM
jgi:hypothetical protein